MKRLLLAAVVVLALAACSYPSGSPGADGGGGGAGGQGGGGAGGAAGDGGAGGAAGAGGAGGGGGDGGAGGAPSVPRFDLDVAGAGFAAHEGGAVRGAVVAVDAGGRRLRASSESRVAGGAFGLHFGGVLPEGETRPYELDVFVDGDGAGGCGPGDLAFRVLLGALSGEVHVALSPDDPTEPEACRTFPPAGGHDASVGARGGFAAHEGKVVRAALSRVFDATTLGGPIQETVVVAGRFEIIFVGLLFDEARETTVIDYYVDVDGDGACDAPPEDHVWRLPLEKGRGNAHHLVADEPDFDAEACRSFEGR